MICLAILAHTLNVDFVKAVKEKIEDLDRRRAADELTWLTQDLGLY